MRYVKMRFTSAGPNGLRSAGKVYEVTDEEAESLIAAEAAIPAAAPPPPRVRKRLEPDAEWTADWYEIQRRAKERLREAYE